MTFAFRQLTKNPGFTCVAVLTLALGIGANTAIFSVINGVLLRPLPFEQPERLMNIWEASQTQNFPKATLPPGNFFDLQAQNRSFRALAAWAPASLNWTGDGGPAERLDGVSVTAQLPAVLGVNAIHGRFFIEEEFTPGRDGVIVLSHSLWRERFGGEPNVIGRALLINGRSRIVVGIMPPGCDYPRPRQAWVPFAPDAELRQRRDWHQLRVIGRLRDGVSFEQARLDLQKINRDLAAQFPDTNRDWTIDAFPMLDDMIGALRPGLMVLLAAVIALLLIACANVASLLLARAAARQSEFALRVSLGATRPRLIVQLLGEALVLFAFGGGAGVLLAQWSLSGLLALAPPNIPRLDQVTIDPLVLGFTFGATLATGLAFGLIPAWQASRVDLAATLRQNDRAATGARSRLRSALVVLQVAAAVTLLAVSGLLIRSFDQVRRVPLGFDPENVLTFHVDLQSGRYDTPEKRVAFLDAVVRDLTALPEVRSAGVTTAVPLDGGPTYIMRFEGRPPVTPSTAPVARHRVVSANYFATIGMSIVRGRAFGAADRPGTPAVCVINQTLAQKYFPHEDPIGRRLEIGFDDPPAWREIVGIVADVKMDGVDVDTPPQVFEPLHQWPNNNYTVAMRTQGEPARLANAVRAAVQKLEPTQPVHTIKPMAAIVHESFGQRRFSLVLIVVFAAVAFALSVVGLYGVVAYNVAQRTRELGVRVALGATARDVLRLVLRQGLALIGIGVGLGLATALVLGRFVQSMLFGVSSHDPATLAATAVLLAAVAIVACLVPAWRATKVDPITTLRTD